MYVRGRLFAGCVGVGGCDVSPKRYVEEIDSLLKKFEPTC